MIFVVGANAVAGLTYWASGAALSFRLSTHYTLRGCHSNNGSASGTFSVYISGTVGFGLWGVGAALIIVTHYTTRGGASNTDFRCGIYFVYCAATISSIYWDCGAALL